MRYAPLKRWFLPTVLLAVSLAISVPAATASDGGLPTGSSVGPVRFDSIMELEAPLSETTTVLFARYWVIGSNYRVEILWAEPHWMAINYAAYPVSLSLLSTDSGLTLANTVRDEQWSRPRPATGRGVFTYANNEYDPLDIVFAESQARDMSLAVEGVPVDKLRGAADTTFSVPASRETAGIRGFVLRLKEGRLDQMDVMAADGNLVRMLRYSYDGDSRDARLAQVTADLPEEKVLVAPGGPAEVTVNGVTRTYSQWLAPYHRGGRKCVTEFTPVSVGGRTANLPALIEVRRTSDGVLLRRARMSDYRAVDAGEVEALLRPEPTGFSSYNADQWSWRRMAIKYRYKPSEEVEPADRADLERLAGVLAAGVDSTAAIGERFRRVHMLTLIRLILGDDAGALSLFNEHCGLLRSNGLARVIMPSGATMLELCLRWNKTDLSDRVLAAWVASACAANDADTLTAAVGRLNDESRFWLAYNLVKQTLAQSPADARSRFAAEYQACMALFGLRDCLRKGKGGEYSLLDIETDWIARKTSVDVIRAEIETHAAAFSEAFSRLPAPSKEDLRRKYSLETRMNESSERSK